MWRFIADWMTAARMVATTAMMARMRNFGEVGGSTYSSRG